MNQLTIIGNLTGDPEHRTTKNGKEVASFTVAVNRRVGDVADYFRVNAWGELGNNCCKYLVKGRKVAVTGSVSVSAYLAQDGSAKGNLEVMAQNVEFLGQKDQAQKPTEQKPIEKKPTEYLEVEDDLPF